MKSLFSILVVSGLLGCGCRSRLVTDSQAWFLESYGDGVITVQHGGNTYKATCEVSRSLHNAASITDPDNVHEFHTCDLAIGLVGQAVQPFQGEQRDADGWIVVMLHAGSTLALRRWRDEQSPWRQDDFKITSVTKFPR
jgi:hypothetical protein